MMKYLLIALAVLLVGCTAQVAEVSQEMASDVIETAEEAEDVIRTVRIFSDRIDTQSIVVNTGDKVRFQVLNTGDEDRVFELQGLYTQEIQEGRSIQFDFVAPEGVYNFGFKTEPMKGKLIVQ